MTRLGAGPTALIQEYAQVGQAATLLLRESGKLWRLIHRAYRDKPLDAIEDGKAGERGAPRNWDHLPDAKINARMIRNELNRAFSFVAKCVRDIPRAENMWPSREQVHSCLVRLYQMIGDLQKVDSIATEAVRLNVNPRRASVADPKRVATHKRPDVDALAAVWLVERFVFESEIKVEFLKYQHDWARGPRVDCVVDMAGMYEPGLLLFDHKQPSRENRYETCATRLVWDYLVSQGKEVGHLEDLVHVVHAGDSPSHRNSPSYKISQREGLHAEFDRAKEKNDPGRYLAVRTWLDRFNKKHRKK